MSTSTRAIQVAANSADDVAAASWPAKRIKLLTGAPDPAKLSWDENSLLVNDWTPAVRRFLKRKFAADEEDEHVQGEPSTTAARWRSISLSRNAHLRTGFTQESPLRKDFLYAPTLADAEHSFALSSQTSTTDGDYDDDASPAAKHVSTVTRSSPNRAVEEDDDDENFIEHSIAVHDDTRSSQLAPPLEDVSTTTTLFDHSFHSTTSDNTSFDSESFSRLDDDSYSDLPSELLPTIQLPRRITALRDVPTAPHLHRLAPQTVVVSLLVGVIAILPARPVRTRRGAVRDLVELLVGDETATGLKISFWFAHEGDESQRSNAAAAAATKKADPLREALRGLRVRDVVLVENVALDTFRDKVFGYSLRKSMQKNQTRVQLLARDGVDRVAGLGAVEKVAGVKEWVWRLVNPGTGEPGGRGGPGEERGRTGDAYLPPDTQE